jgi:hypothetical protein
MKLSKSEFKEMLKEALVELIEDGEISLPESSLSSNPQESQSFNSDSRRSLRERLRERIAGEGDSSMMGEDDEFSQPQNYQENKRLSDAVRMTALSVAKGDSSRSKVLESVFMDTARTTLQKQLNSEMGMGVGGGSGPATPEERIQDQRQLNAFEAKSRWAHLAFGGSKGKT